MADPLSITASIVGITAAGVQVSISLFALAETVSTASERVSSIANDISSTCGILNQLRDLITPQPGFISAHNTSIFNPTALSDIHSALHHCRFIFSQIKKFLQRATKQIKHLTPRPTVSIALSRSEKAKWPFLQAAVQELRNDLRDSKTNLILMVAVADLAMAQRRGHIRVVDADEQEDLKATIVKLQRMKTVEIEESEEDSEVAKDNLFKRFMQKLRLRRAGLKEETENDTDDDRVQADRAIPTATTAGRNVTLSDKPDEENLSAGAGPSAVEPTPPHQAESRRSRSGGPNEAVPVDGDSGPVQTRHAQLNDNQDPAKISNDALAAADPGAAQSTKAQSNDEGLPVVDLHEITKQDTKDPEAEHELHFIDVAVQTSVKDDLLRDQPPYMSPAGQTPTRVQGFEQVAELDSKHRSTLDQPRPFKARGPAESTDSSQRGPRHVKEQKASSVSSKATRGECLQAWIFSILPGLTTGQGSSLGVIDLSISELEIRALLQKQEAQQNSLSDILNQLNTYQRCAVLDQTRRSNSRLLYIDVWHKESIATVFGELEVVTLMWITSSAEKISEYTGSRFDEQNWNMGMGDLKGKAKVGNTTPAPPEPPAEEEPLHFKDAVGRKFVFPFQLVKTWKGMEELVKQAFLHVDIIGPHVQEGHYDLVDSDGKIVLPQTWSLLVQPGWDIVMHMWPMPEPPRPRPQPPPPPPPDAAQFRPNDLPIGRPPRVGAMQGLAPAPPPPPPGIGMPPPPPPAQIYVPPLNHGYLRHSIDGKQNDMSVLKWMAGMAGPGLGKPNFGKNKEKEHIVPYRIVDKGKISKREEDRIVDDLLLKWTA